MVNEKLPNYVVPDLTYFKVLIFVNFKDYLYIFECCESSKGKVTWFSNAAVCEKSKVHTCATFLLNVLSFPRFGRQIQQL